MRSVRAAETGAGGGPFGVLLFGALAAPAAAAILGRPVYSAGHATVSFLVVTVLAAAMPRFSEGGTSAQRTATVLALRFALVVAAALLFSAIVESRANAFYTPEALQGGMIILLALYVSACTLRAVIWRDIRRSSPEQQAVPRHPAHPRDEFDRSPPNEIRTVYPAANIAEPSSGTRRAVVPAISAADLFMRGAAWLFVAFWALVVLEHRHAASLILLSAGVLMLLSVITLLPSVLVARR